VVGRLPFLLSRPAPGLTVVGMPPMTHILGPALTPDPAGQNFPGILKQVSITRDLIAQLPKASHIHFRLHGGLTNTLAFDAAGFVNNVGFTVEIPPDSPDIMWRQMRDKTRNVIRRAQEKLVVSDSLDPGQFLDFYDDNLRRKEIRNEYDARICGNIIRASLNRGVGRVLSTADAAGVLQSAIFTVWDHQKEYYLMSTRTQSSMNGATSLAIWTAMQHAALRGRTFDMDGVHVIRNRLPNLGLLTGFGGAIKPRYVVRRTSRIVRMAQSLKAFLAKG
jgi:hypothetical protein